MSDLFSYYSNLPNEYDNRVPLASGATLVLENRKYTIKRLIGDGGNCLVYEAEYIENDLPHIWIIKELYPHDLSMNGEIIRVEDRIEESRTSTGTFEKRKNLFKKRAMHEAIIGTIAPNQHSTSISYDILHNGTRYSVSSVIDGFSFADTINMQSEIKTLSDVADVLSSVASAIRIYHNNDLIHLDLNDNNIIKKRGENAVALFDYDSIHNKKDLRNGLNLELFFTEEWSAPEVLHQEYRRIDERSDIYALGLILINLLIPCDNPAKFATNLMLHDMGWDLIENSHFMRESKRCMPTLEKIFQRTLSISPELRYSSMSELIEDLQILKDRSTDKVPFRTRMMIYNLLNMNPLYEYEIKNKSGGFDIDVVLVGADSNTVEAFQAIYWCGQMLDRKLRITSISLKDDALRERLENTIPIDFDYIEQFDYAEINWEMDLQRYEDYDFSNLKQGCYFLISTGHEKTNKTIYDNIVASFAKRKTQPFYISMLSNGRFGNEDATPESINNCEMILRETSFQGRFLRLKTDPNMSKPSEQKERLKFISSKYDMSSSIARTLHIKYKLRSCKIDGELEDPNVLEQFNSIILNKKNDDKAACLFRRLSYLEHKRWNAYMLSEGCQCPTASQFEEYAFTGKNEDYDQTDHKQINIKTKAPRYHPCLALSRDDRRALPIDLMDWDIYVDADSIAQLDYDDLDKQSLLIHLVAKKKAYQAYEDAKAKITELVARLKNTQFFDLQQLTTKKVKTIVQDEKLIDIISRDTTLHTDLFALDACLSRAKKNDSLDLMIKLLVKSFETLESNHSTDANKCWNTIVSIISTLCEENDQFGAVSLLADIKKRLTPVIERNKYYDYKFADDYSITDIMPIQLEWCQSQK